MSTTTALAGTYAADPVHSSFGFAVKYQNVSIFRGTLERGHRDARRRQARGHRAGRVDLDPHARAVPRARPERRLLRRREPPAVTFVSERRRRSTTTAPPTVNGDLTIRGITQPVTATGTWQRPVRGRVRQHPRAPAARGRHRPHAVRPELEHAAADRWQGAGQRRHADRRPRARPAGLADADPRHLRQPPPRIPQPQAAPGGGRAAPARGRAGGVGRPRGHPAFDEDLENTPPEAVREFFARDRGRGRAADRDAGVQRVAPGRAQERDRLGLAPVPRERAALQADARSSAPAPACSAPSGRRPRCARR